MQLRLSAHFPIPPVVAAILTALVRLDAAEGGAPGGVSVVLEPERAVIGNPFLSIEMSTASKKVRTRSITNRLTGAPTALEGDDFVLVLAGGKTLKGGNFVLERALEEPSDGDLKCLAFDLAAEDIHLRVRIGMRPKEWWATRWLEIQGGQGRLEKVSLSEWRAQGTYGPPGPGKTTEGLALAQGIGQAAYVDDLFFAIEHPAAENFARGKRIACRIAASDALGAAGKTVSTKRFVLGAGEAGGAPQAFLRFINERRGSHARMAFLASDRLWRSEGLEAGSARTLERIKAQAAIPPDSLILHSRWDILDGAPPFWEQFPGGLEACAAAVRPAGLGLCLRDPKAGSPPCLAAGGGSKALRESLPGGVGLVELDGLQPFCTQEGHGHPGGPAAVTAQLDALIEVLGAWRKARPGILMGWTRGSNPSPFWLEHLDFLGPGTGPSTAAGEAGGGEPFDRHATAIDSLLQVHRPTDLPVSAFAVTDLAAPALSGASDEAFERNAWWLAARTTLVHLWCAPAKDLSPERWRILARAAAWAKARERLFRLGRMVGGDVRQGGLYGFAAFEAGAGALALRNPAPKTVTLELPLSRYLVLTRTAAKKSYRLTGVFGETKTLEGVRLGTSRLKVELPPLAVAILDVKEE